MNVPPVRVLELSPQFMFGAVDVIVVPSAIVEKSVINGLVGTTLGPVLAVEVPPVLVLVLPPAELLTPVLPPAVFPLPPTFALEPPVPVGTLLSPPQAPKVKSAATTPSPMPPKTEDSNFMMPVLHVHAGSIESLGARV